MNFGASAPEPNPLKTGAAHPSTTAGEAANRLHFEWTVSGLTAVCFWTALRRWIAALERPRGVEGLVETAPHWPDRVPIGV